MNRQTSLYLDVWRLLAAFAVFIGHLSGARLTGGFLWQFGPLLGEAVAVFFVLSGFVIGYTATRPGETARSYAVSRLARVYSVALPALILTFALDALGRLHDPGMYSLSWGYVADGRAWQFLSALLFVNQVWGMNMLPGSDLPYWSLGYEAWYYLIFGLATFLAPGWRAVGVLIALACAGPGIAALLPLWLLGVYGYRVCKAGRLSRSAGWVLFAGSLAAWCAYQAWGQAYVESLAGAASIAHGPNLLEDYLIGTLFIGHIIGFHAISGNVAALAGWVQKPIRWAAGATFTIYLLHVPVAQFLATLLPWPPSAWPARAVLLGGTLFILFAVADITERRKAFWRFAVSALISRARRLPEALA